MDVLLGIDDTDVLGHRPGTGRLARDLADYLAMSGLVRANGWWRTSCSSIRASPTRATTVRRACF